MKKIFCLMIAAIMLLLAISVSAAELDPSSESTALETEVVLQEESAESVFPQEDTVFASETITETDALIVIDESMSWNEIVFAVAEACGISIEEAEKTVSNIRIVGDKYFGENDLWVHITEDMDMHPAKWTFIGLVLALALFLVGLLIKRVISDATSMAKLKIAVSNIDAALNGDEKGSDGKALSIRAMINEKNGHIELLEKENEALAAKAEAHRQGYNLLFLALLSR